MILQKNRVPTQIKAPQSIIHIKHTISLHQYKLWIIMLQTFRDFYQHNEAPDENGFYRLSQENLISKIGYEDSKEQLRKDLRKLRGEEIIINYLEKDHGEVTYGMWFISEWKLSAKTIRFRLPKFLEDVMKGLDQPNAMFQLLNWEIFNHFSGKYEAIIYKLCRDYASVRNTPYMTVQEFREYMGLAPTEYSNFMDLNKFVIKYPLEKINSSELSDIHVDWEPKREGRKVVWLYFIVTKKKQMAIPFPEPEENNAFQYSKIHIETSLQFEYLSLRPSAEIALCIERANQYGEDQGQKGKPVNYGALYRKAITEGWHVDYVKQKLKSDKRELAVENIKKSEQHQDSLREEKIEKQKEWISDVLSEFSKLPEERKYAIRNQYRVWLDEVDGGYFEREGENWMMHRFRFAQFVDQHFNKWWKLQL